MVYYYPMYKYSIMYVYVCLSFLPGSVFLLGSLLSPLLGQTLHFDVTSEEGVQILHSGLPSAPLAPIIHPYKCTTVYIKHFHIPLRCKQLLYSTQRKKRLWCITQMYSSRKISAIAASLPLLLQCPSVMSNAQRTYDTTVMR